MGFLPAVVFSLGGRPCRVFPLAPVFGFGRQKAFWGFWKFGSLSPESYGTKRFLRSWVSKPEPLYVKICTKMDSAIDPVNGKISYTSGDCLSLQPDESKSVLLPKRFGIRDIKMSGCKIIDGTTTSQHIAFDFLGRPHRGVAGYTSEDRLFTRLIKEDCNITFTMSTDEDEDGIDDTFSLIVEPETGYSYIVD